VAVTNGYATLAQARLAIGSYAVADTTDDPMIEMAVESASRDIDDELGFRLWQDSAVVVREFYAESPLCVDLYEQDDESMKAGISTTTGLIVKTDDDGDGTFETTLTINTDFILLPLNAGDNAPVEPYTKIRLVGDYSFPRLSNGRPGVQVTAKFGWPAVPTWATQACLIQANHLFKSKDAPFGIATFGDMGGGLRVTSGLNPVAKGLLRGRPSIG